MVPSNWAPIYIKSTFCIRIVCGSGIALADGASSVEELRFVVFVWEPSTLVLWYVVSHCLMRVHVNNIR
jgi:hypothetical protein